METGEYPIVSAIWDDTTMMSGGLPNGEREFMFPFWTIGARLPKTKSGRIILVFNLPIFPGLAGRRIGTFTYPPQAVESKNQKNLAKMVLERKKFYILDARGNPIQEVGRPPFSEDMILR